MADGEEPAARADPPATERLRWYGARRRNCAPFDVLRQVSQQLNRKLVDVAGYLARTGQLPG